MQLEVSLQKKSNRKKKPSPKVTTCYNQPLQRPQQWPLRSVLSLISCKQWWMSRAEPFFACKCSPGKTNRDWIPVWFSPVSRHQHAADGLYTAIRLLLFIWSSVVRLYSAGWQITVQRDKPLMWLIIQNLHKQAEQQAHFSMGVLSWDSDFLNKCVWRNLLSKRENSLLENGSLCKINT